MRTPSESTTGSRPPRTGGPGGRDSRGPGGGHGRPRGDRKVYHRRKVCRFCTDSSIKMSYKDVDTLRYFVTERGKIIPRRITGNCALHQRALTVEIKRARNIALLPFMVTES
jgi:small subunit ribosomal protein S18